MTVYVIRDGELVEKRCEIKSQISSQFPTPMLSRIEPFASPVTGKEIGSWRERDRDMEAAGAVDPRDLPRAPIEKRKEDNARRSDAPFEWRD